jgi:SOS response associated peptidase (SRAP)
LPSLMARCAGASFLISAMTRKVGESRSTPCEIVHTLATFREAHRCRRCIIPGDGFFEWRAIRGQKVKQPYAIAMKDGRPFGLGGIWENWKDPTSGEWIRTVAITRRKLMSWSIPSMTDAAERNRKHIDKRAHWGPSKRSGGKAGRTLQPRAGLLVGHGQPH